MQSTAEMLQQKGLDLNAIKKIMELEKAEKLVKLGKLKPEIFENLRSEALQSLDVGQRKAGKNKKNLYANVRSVLSGKSSAPPAAKKNKMMANLERASSSLRQAAPKRQAVVLEGSLMRLAKTAKGKPKWKSVYAQLHPTAIVLYANKKSVGKSPLKTIQLNEDYFVQAAKSINKRALEEIDHHEDDEDDNASTRSDLSAGKEMNRNYMFTISDLDEEYYFAAEGAQEAELWLHVMTNIIRDLNHKQNQTQGVGGPGISIQMPHQVRTAEQIQADMEARQQAYIKSQRKRTTARPMKKNTPEAQDEYVEQVVREERKWAKDGKRHARQSVAVDLIQFEKARAKRDLEEQDRLRKGLEEAQRIADQWKAKYEQKQLELGEKEKELHDVEKLMESFREQARERAEAKANQETLLKQKMQTLQRKSMSARGGGDMSEYEAEIEALRTKLKALQSALNVDLDNLDWDGTLEDAEEKMKLLVPDLMSENPEVQQKAQQEFDQWDQIIRNHGDYLDRENNKWKTWEEENYEKNLDALNEMKLLAPPLISHGYSLENLMKQAKIEKKTARRIQKNNIFKFFYMEKPVIAKIHIADLVGRYATQGLDLREMRAVYACLPDEFLLDNDGRKKQFREQIRNRLFELTEKQKSGRLTAQEELNNAYRKSEVKKKKVEIKGAKGKKKAGGAMAQKAAMLQLMLQEGNAAGQGGAKPPAAGGGAKKKGALPKLPPGDPRYATYFKMHKAGLPDGAIMNRIRKDGFDPSNWPDALAHHEKGGSAGGAAKPAPVAAAAPTPAATPAEESGGLLSAITNLVIGADQNAKAEEAKPAVKKQKRKSKRVKGSSKEGKKDKRKSNKIKKGGPLLGKGTDDLVNAAAAGVGSVRLQNGATAHQFEEYGAQAKSRQRGAKMQKKIEANLDQLLDEIREHGAYDKAEGGVKTITFGELSLRYEKISNILVGLLFKAKKKGLLKYRGDMLFQGIHDDIKITVLS